MFGASNCRKKAFLKLERRTDCILNAMIANNPTNLSQWYVQLNDRDAGVFSREGAIKN